MYRNGIIKRDNKQNTHHPSGKENENDENSKFKLDGSEREKKCVCLCVAFHIVAVYFKGDGILIAAQYRFQLECIDIYEMGG